MRKIEAEIDRNLYLKRKTDPSFTLNDLFIRFEKDVIPKYLSYKSSLIHLNLVKARIGNKLMHLSNSIVDHLEIHDYRKLVLILQEKSLVF